MMSSLSLHAASLSTNNTGLELLHLVSEIYKTQLHWGTKCGHGWCTNTAAFCAQNTAVWVHKTQLCWCTKHSCILYPNAAVVCTPTRPHFVPQCSCDLYTNTAKFYAPTRPRFVHGMRLCQCTNNS